MYLLLSWNVALYAGIVKIFHIEPTVIGYPIQLFVQCGIFLFIFFIYFFFCVCVCVMLALSGAIGYGIP